MLITLVSGDWLPVKVIALSAYSLAVVLAFAALARNLTLSRVNRKKVDVDHGELQSCPADIQSF